MFDYDFTTHTYTLAVEGLNVKTKRFASRQAANDEMYRLIKVKRLELSQVYDDNHFKTYIFTNGVRIHINREF